MGCWVYFLGPFLRAMDKCKSWTTGDGVDDENKCKVKVLVAVRGSYSWNCTSLGMCSFLLE